jgi:hypothetical protein
VTDLRPSSFGQIKLGVERAGVIARVDRWEGGQLEAGEADT